MLIIPAIDLMDGRCVRLLHGDFGRATRYGDPLEQLAEFEGAGAEWAHIVDLDGARSGARRQSGLIARLAASSRVQLQCGGGVRTRDDLTALFDAGVARAVIGSAAVKAPEEVNRWIEEFGAAKTCCAFDARADSEGVWRVATDGWANDAGFSLDGALTAYPEGGLEHVLVTDISRDGALTGPNVALLKSVIEKRPDLRVQASGGVSSLADLDALAAAGAGAVIIGRALYERKFTLEAALGR